MRNRALGWATGTALFVGCVRALRSARGGSAVVVYDGQCPLCLRTVETLRRLDRGDRLRFVDGRDADAVREKLPSVVLGPDLSEMRVVLADGSVPGGFDAVRVLCALLPPLQPLAPLLYVPGAEVIGRPLYRWVARRRPLPAGCDDGACATHAR